MKLLIVDDEPIVRRGIKTLIDFQSMGIDEVLEAANGEIALAVFEAEKPEMVLLDINMPKIDGLTLAKKIKEMVPLTQIAMITGYDYFDYAREAIKIGVQDYILKPVSKDDIRQVVADLKENVLKLSVNQEFSSVVEQLTNQGSGDAGTEEKSGYREQILNYLSEHINDESLSLTSMADALSLSSGYLGDLFKQLFQVNFKDYVLDQRLGQAKLMLLGTQLKNYEIAQQIGFTDANYFSTAFKKRYGVSPGAYRQKVKG